MAPCPENTTRESNSQPAFEDGPHREKVVMLFNSIRRARLYGISRQTALPAEPVPGPEEVLG